jgi:hypothetical protein
VSIDPRNQGFPGSDSAYYPPAAQAALRDLARLFADAPPGDSTAAIRVERDARLGELTGGWRPGIPERLCHPHVLRAF